MMGSSFQLLGNRMMKGTLAEASARARRAVESRLIRRTLAECGHNKSEVARRLDVNYKTLLQKIKDYELDEA